MVDIDLYSDEIVILNSETGYLNKKAGELILTNKRIIWAKKAVFGKAIKDMQEIPLDSIKTYNGEPQVKLAGQMLQPELQIQHAGGIDNLQFMNRSRKETVLWLNEIHRAITGEEASANAEKMGNLAIPGMDILGKGIKDSVGAFASGLGIKEAIVKEKHVSTECSTCGSPISGVKGEKVTCEYCGTVQILK